MNKLEFLAQLREALSGLPKEDIEERLDFYSEMIDDRIEEGLSEEEAVSQIGEINEIVSQIVADTPFYKIVKKRISKRKKLSALEIILLALGSPIWLSLLVAALAVILAVYVSFWAIIISLWAVFVAVAACTVAGFLGGITLALTGNVLSGIALIAAGFVLAGIGIFLFLGCKLITKAILLMTKKTGIAIKNCFIKKGGANDEKN